jgi:methyl coenzyme M reductase subunit C
LPKLLCFELGSGHDRNHRGSVIEADAASYCGFAASPGQRPINEITVASRRDERNEVKQQNQTSFTFLRSASDAAAR